MDKIKKGALWVFCEVQAGELLPVGLQLLGRAKVLAAESNRPLYAVVLGQIPQGGVEVLGASGADEVLCGDGPALAQKVEQPYADCLIALAQKFEPDILLIGATPFGRAFAPVWLRLWAPALPLTAQS